MTEMQLCFFLLFYYSSFWKGNRVVFIIIFFKPLAKDTVPSGDICLSKYFHNVVPRGEKWPFIAFLIFNTLFHPLHCVLVLNLQGC